MAPYLIDDAAREAPPVGAGYWDWANRLMLLTAVACYPGDLSRFGACGAIPWDDATAFAPFGKYDEEMPVPILGRSSILFEADGSLRGDLSDQPGVVTRHHDHTPAGKPFRRVANHPTVRGMLGTLSDRLTPILAELRVGESGNGQAAADAAAGTAQAPPPVEPPKVPRRGRLSKADGDAKRAQLLATIRQHPTLKDDVGALAAKVEISEPTVRRWLAEEETKYRQSKAANPDPGEE